MPVPVANLAKVLASGPVQDGDAAAPLQPEDIPGMMSLAPGQFEQRRAALRGRQVEAVHLAGNDKGKLTNAK
jgi:hypothetical protein